MDQLKTRRIGNYFLCILLMRRKQLSAMVLGGGSTGDKGPLTTVGGGEEMSAGHVHC